MKLIPPECATACVRLIVAMLPLSKYLNGATLVSPSSRAQITLPTYFLLEAPAGRCQEAVEGDHVADGEHCRSVAERGSHDQLVLAGGLYTDS
ncbi:MAG: hypothetical protein JWR37_691 [Mycobacterium sp.]|nr:hypothetical protein [Mycobacterium sp.]